MSSTFTLPRVDKRPHSVGSHGPTVIRFCEAVGVDLFDWQKHVIDSAFAVDAAGNWAASEFGLLVARQNGKGEILVAYTLAHLFLFPRADNRRKTILYSAHEVKTSDDGFERIRSIIEASPSLMNRVEHIYTANGKGSIRLKPRKGQKMGDRVLFVARSKSSGRGFSGDVIIQDEAQEESVQAHTALTYTQSAVKNRQEFFCGTVPEDGVNESEVFEGVRDRGRSDEESRTAWMEWSPEGSDDPVLAGGINFEDEDVWLAANPSAPFLIGLDVVADQLSRDVSPGKETFARERLSVWPAREDAAVVVRNDLDMEKWASRVVEFRPEVPKRGVVIAPVVADGNGYGSVAVGWMVDEDTTYVEHVATRPQTAWIPGFVAELVAEFGADSVVMDERKNAAIVAGLGRERVKFLKMSAVEVAAAQAITVEKVNAGLVAHRDQVEVVESMRHAETRNVGSYGKTWKQGDPSEPVTQLQAVSNAIWGVANLEAFPVRKGRVRGVRG